jgi:hypothetical protein
MLKKNPNNNVKVGNGTRSTSTGGRKLDESTSFTKRSVDGRIRARCAESRLMRTQQPSCEYRWGILDSLQPPRYRRSSEFCWAFRSFGGIGLLAFFSIQAAADAVPSEVIGEYSGLPCPKGDVSCVPTHPSDRLRIFHAPNDTVRVSVNIAFERGQRCQIETELTYSDHLLQARAEGLEENAMCELKFRQQGSALIVEDVGLRCREVYCGTGGTFSGARFKRR